MTESSDQVKIVPEETFYITYFDGISMQKVQQLMSICSQIIEKIKGVKTLYFLISSPGGEVLAGVTLHNWLRGLPVNIVMHNIGTIDSIANVVYMAGKQRFANPGTSFLFHGVAMGFTAEARLNRRDLTEKLSSLTQDENKIAELLSLDSNLSESEIRTLFDQGDAKSLNFVVEKGVVHEVRDATIPKNAAGSLTVVPEQSK